MSKLATINGAVCHPESTIKSAGGIARPSRAQVEEAVGTLIRWTADDPGRERLAPVWCTPMKNGRRL
jgi:hypothetical protein